MLIKHKKNILYIIILFYISICNSANAAWSWGNDQRPQLIKEYKNLGKRSIPKKSDFVDKSTYKNPGNFRFRELVSKYKSRKYRWVIFNIARHLQNIRNRIGWPMVLNSGYRNPYHNRNVGGARESAHMYGAAADVRPPDFNRNGKVERYEKRILRYEALREGADYIGLYARHVHMDWRCDKPVSSHTCRYNR